MAILLKISVLHISHLLMTTPTSTLMLHSRHLNVIHSRLSAKFNLRIR